MTKITTADCKKFLVEFFRSTPTLIAGIYGAGSEAAVEVARDALLEKHWKRDRKFKLGGTYPRGPSYHRVPRAPHTEFAVVREITSATNSLIF